MSESGFREALERIASYGCENYTGENDCLRNPERTRDAKYSAERWCLPCHAISALAEDFRSRKARPPSVDTGEERA